MAFVLRHPASAAALLLAGGAMAAALTVARPQYHPQYESKMIDFAEQRYYSPGVVRAAFAGQGVSLEYPSRAYGVLVLGNEPEPRQADALQVAVGPREGTGSWGPKLEPFDERFGNLLVTYGGNDQALLRRIQLAVNVLRARRA